MADEHLKVIYRMMYNPYIKTYECVAFFPEVAVKFGNICCYVDKEGHGEASLTCYQNTKCATPAQYAALHDYLQNRVYTDTVLDVRQRLCYNDLRQSWNTV